EAALAAAAAEAPKWAAVPPSERARVLRLAGDLMEQELIMLVGILVREAGKSYANAIAEVREAVDFLRFYSTQVDADFDNATHVPLGVVTCISPWNFPLAIFSGQVAAALAAGNVVLAKPAEQTTLIAAQAVRMMWQAGIPRCAVQLVPGKGAEVGPLLTADDRVQGVMFTGSTEVARELQRTLARRLSPEGRPIPLVAETGGQNAMIVDSSALAEQVVRDVIVSAFDSAGQRCSALRVLCIQEDVADPLMNMLTGAMRELRVVEPTRLDSDVGPVIDARARDNIERHINVMRSRGRAVHQLCLGIDDGKPAELDQGTYVLPTLIEIESMGELEREVFGPVLHVMRYRREELDDVLEQVWRTGYGLTMGLHTRIDETIRDVAARARVGNLYVNRNMVGAVVGVQPFGGEGLSGTGPKAGGPLYLYRLLKARPDAALARPFGVVGDAGEFPFPEDDVGKRPLATFKDWCSRERGQAMPPYFPFFSQTAHLLRGPTGERNVYQVFPRSAVLCLADTEDDLITQLGAVLSVGAFAVWDGKSEIAANLYRRLPAAVQACVALEDHWPDHPGFEVALHHGSPESLAAALRVLAEREGAIVPVASMSSGDTAVPLERLVVERSISIDTTAAGGNASLMTMS